MACCAGDSKGGSLGGNSTAHHQGPGRLPSAHSCHTLQELCKAQVSLSVLIVPAVLHDLDQLHAHTLHSQRPEADIVFQRCLTTVSCMCRLPHSNASCTAFCSSAALLHPAQCCSCRISQVMSYASHCDTSSHIATPCRCVHGP